MLGTQPLTQPLPGVSIYRSIGLADWSQAEVVGPPRHHAVEHGYHLLVIQQDVFPSSHLANRSTDADHPLLGRDRAQVGSAGLQRVALTERVSQKVSAPIAPGGSE